MRLKQLTWFFIGLALSTLAATADERGQVQPVSPTLSWHDSLEKALKASKKSGKPILLEFR